MNNVFEVRRLSWLLVTLLKRVWERENYEGEKRADPRLKVTNNEILKIYKRSTAIN